MKQESPEIAQLFEDESKIEQMEIPQIDESAMIYHHWEKVAKRMMAHMTNTQKNPKAWIFLEPVNPEKLGINDYHDIIQRPMDFGTIKDKLNRHGYMSMQNFLQDVEVVFSNCLLYNGELSQVSQMCREV